MDSEKESFEETQARLLGKRPSWRRALARRLKSIKWGKVLRTAFYPTIIFLVAISGIISESGMPIYGFLLAGALIFMIATGIAILIQIDPLAPDDET